MRYQNGVLKCIQNFFQKYNLPITILRLFNVFGPFQRTDSIYSAVIPKWIKNLNSNNSIDIYGSKKFQEILLMLTT